VLGLVGLFGSGVSAVLGALYGRFPDARGEIRIAGTQSRLDRPGRAIQEKIAYVPADRQAEGLFAEMNVAENAGMLLLRRIARIMGWVPSKLLSERVQRMIRDFRIRTSSPRSPVSSLSGGNQQKVVIARSLSTNPRLILLDDPTRGIDVGAKAEVHQLLNDLTKQGCGVLLVSSELNEVLAMSDRIIVMYRGQAHVTMDWHAVDHEKVMELASGVGAAA
jgi:ribose transport system ATP-binding protein